MVNIELVTKHPLEESKRQQLLRIIGRYRLSRWQFTNYIQVQHCSAPHSHPTLTLNTRVLEDDILTVATYLHEQLHWCLEIWCQSNDEDILEQELQGKYPSVPGPSDGGAEDASSTYLHLVVCSLEVDVLASLFDLVEAGNIVKRQPVYQWIYESILHDWPYFDQLLDRYRLRPSPNE